MEINSNYEIKEFKRLKDNHEKKLRLETKNKDKQISKLRANSQKDIEVEKSRLKNKIIAYQKSQQNRLEKIRSKYDDSLKVIKARFDQELTRLKTNFLSSKTKIYGQDQDQFMDRLDIKTRIIDQPKYVELEIHIPKKQSQNLFATIDKRNIKINLTRRYDDNYSKADEDIYYKKNHSVTKSMYVDDILDEKSVSKVVLENKTIFKIAKA